MKIVKILSVLSLLFILFNVSGEVNSVPNTSIDDSFQNKIDQNAKHFFLFSYFTGQAGGAHLALSTDGLYWEQLNGGQPVIIPQIGSEKLMRDPSINRGKDGVYRMVWTSGGAPGNNGPIDAFIYKDGKKRYIMFYKKDDNSRIPNVYYRIGKTPEGTWGEEFEPVKPSTGDEGPSVLKMGNRYCMFTDPFESDFAYVFSSKNLKDWQREVTDLKMAHGTVIEIPKETAIKLLKNARNEGKG